LGLAHKYAARRWSTVYYWLGIPSAVLSSVSGISAFSNFDQSKIIIGILSLLVAVLTATNIFLEPNKKANIHLTSSNKYNQLKNRAEKSISVSLTNSFPQLRSGLSSESLDKEFVEISDQIQSIASESPILPEWAIRKARRTLEPIRDNSKAFRDFNLIGSQHQYKSVKFNITREKKE